MADFVRASGDWVWDIDHREPGEIVSSDNLWGHQLVRLWLPGKDATVCVSNSSLLPLEESPYFTSNRLVFITSSARIINERAQNKVFSPIECNIIPLPHQIHALQRALSKNRIRCLLADEVGLGKTIEAGLILKELKLRGLVKRILIVAPKGLVPQWIEEMNDKFNEHFHFLRPGDMQGIATDINFWKLFDQVICPFDSVKPLDNRRGWSKDELSDYNRRRFEDLITAGWDLVIIDEAHRLSGSTDSIARYKLGRGLSESSPYLLLLSATPHQGKTESFHRLMSLLDRTAFPNADSISRDRVSDYLIRTEKRKAINQKGDPLFKHRFTQLMPIEWGSKYKDQRLLYEMVTEYVRYGYNQAITEKRNYIGFLMVLMQRLVSSSTTAIRCAMEERLKILEDNLCQTPSGIQNNDEDWWDMGGQEQLNELLKVKTEAIKNEKDLVDKILQQANKCEAFQPDAKAEALLNLMFKLQNDERNPDIKYLVFTEFIQTQTMLKKYLESRGFKVTCLNGSMDIDDRRDVQKAFSSEKQILISTDAGGEGLNLQFCHIVINYDLPWNPMKIEQRIGRVDRIGQEMNVKAFNMLLENSVEYRVHEILQQKLGIILAEFGVDKTSDVLDSTEIEIDFNNLFIESVLDPSHLDDNIEGIVNELKKQINAVQKNKSLLTTDDSFDLDMISKMQDHPMPIWVEKMVTEYLKSMGCEVIRRLKGYYLKWPDGEPMDNVSFNKYDTNDTDMLVLNLEHPKVQGLLTKLPSVAQYQPIPCIKIKSLEPMIKGYWSIWKISILSNSMDKYTIVPVFLSDEDKVLIPTAKRIWDTIIEKSDDILVNKIVHDNNIFEKLLNVVKQVGRDTYQELLQDYQKSLNGEREKQIYFFKCQRDVINRHGLENVRYKRLRDLDIEYERWEKEFLLKENILPEVKPILIIRVEGCNEMV